MVSSCATNQTVPKSARGTANSSRNARKHGLLSRRLIIAGEDRGKFDDLLFALQSQLRSVGLLENVLTKRIAVTLWGQRRLVHAESSNIALRAHEKSGLAAEEFRRYVSDDLGDKGTKGTLDTLPIDVGTFGLLAEVDDFDTTRENAFELLGNQCPNAFEVLKKRLRQKSIRSVLCVDSPPKPSWLSFLVAGAL